MDFESRLPECHEHMACYPKRILSGSKTTKCIGDDFDVDMVKMAAHQKTKEWSSIMEPMQQPVENRKEGECWASMEEVFHLD